MKKLPLGSFIPCFELPDINNRIHKCCDLFGRKGLVIIFACHHCEYGYSIWPKAIKLYHKVKDKGINFIVINSSKYPEDSLEKIKNYIEKFNIPFVYLIDKEQKVAKRFGLQGAPDIYLYNFEKKLVYHGRFDDNWKNYQNVKSRDLENAINNLLEGKSIDENQYPSIGCAIGINP